MQTVEHKNHETLHPIWADALLAADILALNGSLIKGIEIKASAGPVRDAWLSYAQKASAHTPSRITPDISNSQLLGGIDIAMTLAVGKPVSSLGILEKEAVLIMAMAERCTSGTASIIARGLDQSENLRLIALNEAEANEANMPTALRDRLDMQIYLDGLSYRQAPHVALRTIWPSAAQIKAVTLSDEMTEALVLAALKTGNPSLRKALSLMEVARCIAALDNKQNVDSAVAATAIRLVCANVLDTVDDSQNGDDSDAPDSPPPPPPPPPPHEKPDNDNQPQDDEPQEQAFDPSHLLDMLIETAKAERPDLALMTKPLIEKSAHASTAGKSGAMQQRTKRGKPVGHSVKPPFADARPDVLATLRNAAPWQMLRRKALSSKRWQPGEKLMIRQSDFRYKKLRQRTESVAIFAVDASGSTALERLAEAKGAIELILSDCYARRDAVALIAFRGEKAELILEPTRSLVRAKRALSGLPAGGPTPLASAIIEATELAAQIKRKGQSPLMIFLTDGKGNISLDGQANRAKAKEDMLTAARKAASLELQSVIIDIARRPRDTAQHLANAMHADYCLLPQCDASAVSKIVTDYIEAK